jgi:hypothetical protein
MNLIDTGPVLHYTPAIDRRQSRRFLVSEPEP